MLLVYDVARFPPPYYAAVTFVASFYLASWTPVGWRHAATSLAASPQAQREAPLITETGNTVTYSIKLLSHSPKYRIFKTSSNEYIDLRIASRHRQQSEYPRQ